MCKKEATTPLAIKVMDKERLCNMQLNKNKEKTRLKNEALGIEPYTLESFIREADLVHNGYYSYDLINSFRFKKIII